MHLNDSLKCLNMEYNTFVMWNNRNTPWNINDKFSGAQMLQWKTQKDFPHGARAHAHTRVHKTAFSLILTSYNSIIKSSNMTHQKVLINCLKD